LAQKLAALLERKRFVSEARAQVALGQQQGGVGCRVAQRDQAAGVG
jgi:hypothetical protein